MQRYFIKSDQINNPHIDIIGEDCFHIQKVMRMKVGDCVICCDQIHSYIARIDNISVDSINLTIIEELLNEVELPCSITIAQGLVMRDKMETVIDNITELGANTYIPVRMEFSNAKWNDEKNDKRMTRLNKIAKEASEQSHRTKILNVLEPISFEDLLGLNNQYDLCLFAYEKASAEQSLRKLIKNKKLQNILVLVGPEGGISKEEVSKLMDNNFIPITLGPRILRTEVAPAFIMSALSYELEEENDI